MSKRVFIYARISEKDPTKDKVAGQIADCRKRFEEYGTDNIREFSDDGLSATSGVDRPQWLAMLDAIERGECDVVVATEEERFSRGSRTDKADLFAACLTGRAFWHTIRDGIVNPAKDDDAEFMSDLRDSLGRREVRRKTSRQLAAFEKEIEEGRPLWGQKPFGYDADPDAPVGRNGKRSKRWTVINKEEAREIRWAYDVVLGGGTLYSIITSWNSRGILTTRGKTWSYATVQQLLRRPRNAGIVMHNDVEQVGVEAAWPALVTREELEAVTAILTDSKRNTAPGRKGRKPVHLLSSVIYCAVCGAVMRSGSMNVQKVRVPMYKCSAKAVGGKLGERHPTIRTPLIDPMVREAVIDAFVFGPADLIGTDDSVESTAPLDAELSELRAARTRLLNQVEVEKTVDMEDITPQLRRIKTREQELEAQLVERARNMAQAGMTADLRRGLFGGERVSFERVGVAREALGERFDALPLEQRKVLVRDLLDVRVGLGRTMGRVSVRHLVVTSLNSPVVEEEQAEQELLARDTPVVHT